jgi:hypothetical protein
VVYDAACVSATVSDITVKFLTLFQMVLCGAPNADFNTLLFRLCQTYVYYFCSFIVKLSASYDFFLFCFDVISVGESKFRYHIKTNVRLLRNSSRYTLYLNITPGNSFC